MSQDGPFGRPQVLFIEPYHGGSHASFVETLTQSIDAEWTVLSLPGRHWKWRAQGSAVWFTQVCSEMLNAEYDLVMASSYLSMTDLVALAPTLRDVPRVLYFHENQFAYPVRLEQSRSPDRSYGFRQLISALASDHCLFNSQWNLDSFLDGGADLLRRMPDAVPSDWIETIRGRSTVLPIPMDLPSYEPESFEAPDCERGDGPIILWNHRWEFDKAPEVFFGALQTLDGRGVPFRVAVCGERFRTSPTIFEEARAWLGERIVHWGYCESRAEYEALLKRSHLVVSTAIHEFFGIAMLEATHYGAHPLVPNRLAYPEHFGEAYRYESDADLCGKLERLCLDWSAGTVDLRGDRQAITEPYGERLIVRYQHLVDTLSRGSQT